MDMVHRAKEGETARGRWREFAWAGRELGAYRTGWDRGYELIRRHLHCLCGEGRPALFLVVLCGLAGGLLMPVALSLSLPFFTAALGVVVVSVWTMGSPAESPVAGLVGEVRPYREGSSGAEREPESPISGESMNRRHVADAGSGFGRLVKRLGASLLRPSSRQQRVPAQCLLADLFEDTASLVGEEFVRAALVGLRHALRVRYVLLAEPLSHTRLRVRECCSDGREVLGLEYDITGSPCERVMRRELSCYPAGVKALFPGHLLVQTLDVEGYLGVPLFGCDGRTMGLLALVHDEPLQQSDLAGAACRPLARRISAELERIRLEQDLRRSEHYYRQIAFNDSLTGLSSRLVLMNRLEHALERARRWGHGLGVLFLDIDGFKRVNDRAGHEVGDQVLVDAATRAAGCVRSADTVARLGGDEFVILLEQCDRHCEARVVAEHLLCAFSRPFDAAGHSWSLSTSIGISMYDGSGPDLQPPELLRQADRAMYQAKQAGPGGYRFASPEPFRESREEMVSSIR